MGTYRSIFPVAFYINIAFLSFYGPNILCSTLFFFFKYLCHRPSIAVESCVLLVHTTTLTSRSVLRAMKMTKMQFLRQLFTAMDAFSSIFDALRHLINEIIVSCLSLASMLTYHQIDQYFFGALHEERMLLRANCYGSSFS